jgi:hypothetical protein
VQAAALRLGAFGGSVVWSGTRALPPDVAPTDPAAVGRTLAALIKEGGVSAKSAVFAIGRSVVSTKRIELPTREAAELPEMVRLAMQRELPIDAASAVIDFMTIGTTATGTRVLVVAVPEPVLAFERAVAAAAGLEVEAITLRSLGTAHLISRLDPASVRRMEGEDPLQPAAVGDPAPEGVESILAVDISEDTLELAVVGQGHLRFARGVELQEQESSLLRAEAASLETRRSWLSYRISQSDERVGAAVVLGGSDVARLAVPQLAASTGLPIRLLRQHPDIRGGGAEIASPVWPLVGLLLSRRPQRNLIDFAHPKKAPDLAARRRMRVLAALGIVGVAALAGWTIGQGNLRDKEATAAELEGRARAALSEFLRLKRDRLKVQHLQAWADAPPAWLDHALAVGTLLPDPSVAVIHRLQASLDANAAAVRYGRDRTFTTDRQVQLILDGEAADRGAADALRARIVEDVRYQLRSTGADSAGGKRLPIPFTFRLRSGDAAPADPTGEESAEGGSAQRDATSARAPRRRAPGAPPIDRRLAAEAAS